MACILINGEVQSTFSIKDLEKDIRDICSKIPWYRYSSYTNRL